MTKLIKNTAENKEIGGFLNTNQAAAYLSYKPSYIRKLTHYKAIPFHKRQKNGRLFFVKSELEAWVLLGQPSVQKIGLEVLAAQYNANRESLGQKSDSTQ